MWIGILILKMLTNNNNFLFFVSSIQLHFCINWSNNNAPLWHHFACSLKREDVGYCGNLSGEREGGLLAESAREKVLSFKTACKMMSQWIAGPVSAKKAIVYYFVFTRQLFYNQENGTITRDKFWWYFHVLCVNKLEWETSDKVNVRDGQEWLVL